MEFGGYDANRLIVSLVFAIVGVHHFVNIVRPHFQLRRWGRFCVAYGWGSAHSHCAEDTPSVHS